MLAQAVRRQRVSGASGPMAGMGSGASRHFAVCWAEAMIWIHTWLYLHLYFLFVWFPLLLNFHFDS